MSKQRISTKVDATGFVGARHKLVEVDGEGKGSRFHFKIPV
jgi:hypothetical protein